MSKITRYTVVVFANDTIFIFVLGQYLFFSSVPVSVMKPRFLRFLGTGSGTSVLVLTSRYQSLGTRFSGIICIFSHFGTSSVPFRLLEPKALVLETAQKIRYQNKEVAVTSVCPALDQH